MIGTARGPPTASQNDFFRSLLGVDGIFHLLVRTVEKILQDRDSRLTQNTDLLIALAQYATIMILIVVLGTTIVGSIAFWKTDKGAAKTFSLLLQRASALQMLTVILIIVAACALRLVNAINSEAVISLLSGVAGFVLGNVGKIRQGEDEKTE